METGAQTRMMRTRRTILDAARGLFLETGYTPTSMDEVAAAAGVSKQTVYAHFGSKEALFIELVDSMTGTAGDTHRAQLADPVDDRPIQAFLTEYAERQLAIVLTPELMRLRRLVIGEAGRFPELGRTLHARGPGRSIGRLTQALEHYRALGQVRTEDPRSAAAFFNWLVMGEPVNDAMLMGDGAIPKPAALRAHAREAVRIFLSAYAS
jgi:TetR/AcrR family transcriptional repressor of mexJK operon